MEEKTYRGSCFCGSVEIAVTGKPEAMGFCHCESCRAWAAAPVNAFTLWRPSSIAIARGRENIAVYHRTERSHRQFCRNCGGHIMTAHPHWDLIDVYSAIVPELAFEPALHVAYAERVLPIRDGLPKYRDIPKELGGTGEMMAE